MDRFKQMFLVMLISTKVSGDPDFSLFEEYIFGGVLLDVCVTENKD